MNKSESLKALATALVKAQKKMGAALKDSKNPFFKSKYADLNAIIDAAIPALNEEGIAVLQAPDVLYTPAGSVPVIQTILLHESGEYISGNSEIVAAKSNDPQSAGSATTYARRYGLQAMVTLKAEDDDGEGAMGRKVTQTQTAVKITENASKQANTGDLTLSVGTKETGKVTLDVSSKGSQAEPAKKKVSFSKKSVTSQVSTGDDI